jgi:hypothetical protein
LQTIRGEIKTQQKKTWHRLKGWEPFLILALVVCMTASVAAHHPNTNGWWDNRFFWNGWMLRGFVVWALFIGIWCAKGSVGSWGFLFVGAAAILTPVGPLIEAAHNLLFMGGLYPKGAPINPNIMWLFVFSILWVWITGKLLIFKENRRWNGFVWSTLSITIGLVVLFHVQLIHHNLRGLERETCDVLDTRVKDSKSFAPLGCESGWFTCLEIDPYGDKKVLFGDAAAKEFLVFNPNIKMDHGKHRSFLVDHATKGAASVCAGESPTTKGYTWVRVDEIGFRARWHANEIAVFRLSGLAVWAWFLLTAFHLGLWTRRGTKSAVKGVE